MPLAATGGGGGGQAGRYHHFCSDPIDVGFVIYAIRSNIRMITEGGGWEDLKMFLKTMYGAIKETIIIEGVKEVNKWGETETIIFGRRS